MTRLCKESDRRRILAGLAALSAAPAFARGTRRVVVEIVTEAGRLAVEADPARAPISAGDFLSYVDKGLYEGGAFYRVVRPDNDVLNPVKASVVQGGLTDLERRLPGVPLEPTTVTGIRHRDGVVSLARPITGLSSAGAFFICIGDQPDLDYGGRRNPDRKGFSAFGRVVRGMDLVRDVWRRPVAGAPGSPNGQTLLTPVKILAARRV